MEIIRNFFFLLDSFSLGYHSVMEAFSITKTVVVVGTLALAVALYWYLYE